MISHKKFSITPDTLGGKAVLRVRTSDKSLDQQPILVGMSEGHPIIDRLDGNVDHKSLEAGYALWQDKQVRGGFLGLGVARKRDEIVQEDEVKQLGFHEGKGEIRCGAEILVKDGSAVLHQVDYRPASPPPLFGRPSISRRIWNIIEANSQADAQEAWLVAK
jgi:hypothetical protein